MALEKRKAYSSEKYWGKPVPNFGDPKAKLLVVGLAPAAHGANRTGRMFTGDQSGLWLYRALYRAGFANQPLSENILKQSASDGLKLSDALITAVAHCAPPENKPTPLEIKHCSPYLKELLKELRPRVILTLGQIAWTNILRIYPLGQEKLPRFSHGAKFQIPNGPVLIASYHPSQQNTFTKRLTESMFDSVFKSVRSCLS